ncbi:hypothetical protein CQ018_11960 [Arthrobacter sp. MYb227]|uniref:hypothetical protein n=1 Tax=Arthrobacter sp. MYb227 TaxID=1848601 RepID=UPI000CFC1B4C|nr:hypothetical protein [Arthrobacter sp. MYb227]PQZ92222.1 hypothetical protein CQ018_11960 [Arthrobacter sp. MYb227]
MDTFTFKDQTIHYEHRKGTSDRRHLIVVFSGFRPRGTFDLHGESSRNIKCDILWIEDWFEKNHAYYITTGGDLEVAEAVNALIEETRRKAQLEKNECTMLGFSKGGTGALYQALAYEYGNVIAVAPRMNFASANRQRNLDVFENITSLGTDEEVERLDRILPNLLEEKSSSSINIYLFSSQSDYQYATEIEPYISTYEQYGNFNYVQLNSPFVTDHIDVSRYSVPMVLSILTALAERAKLRFGRIESGDFARAQEGLGAPSIDKVALRNESIFSLDSASIANGKLYPNGVAFIKGNQALTYGSIQRWLILRSKENTKRFALGSLNDRGLSSKYFENEFCDYSKARFASMRQAGIDLAEIPDDVYEIGVALKHAGQSLTQMSVELIGQESYGISGDSIVEVKKTVTSTILVKRPLISETIHDPLFSLVSTWSTEGRIHVEGIYAIAGQPTPEWSDIQYFLVLRKAGSKNIRFTGLLAKDHKPEINNLVSDKYADYSKSYYTTPKYLGIPLQGIGKGSYEMFITRRTVGGVFTWKIEDLLVID